MMLSIVGYIAVFWICCKVEYNGRPLIYLWSDYFSSNGGPTHLKSIEWKIHCENHKHWDAIVVGSSRAERGYDPNFFAHSGIQIFNFGTSAQSIQNSNILVDQILNGSCTINEVWIDLYPTSFKDDALQSSADLIQNLSFCQVPWLIAAENRDFRVVNLILKRFFCSNKEVNLGIARYQTGGYVFVDEEMSNDLKLRAASFKEFEGSSLEIGHKSIAAFESIIENCERHNVKCRFIISPISTFATSIEFDRMLSAINPVLKEHGLSIINLSHLSEIRTINHFYDEKHLNKQGVLLFNGALLEKLDR